MGGAWGISLGLGVLCRKHGQPQSRSWRGILFLIFILILLFFLHLHRVPPHNQEIAAGCPRYSCRDIGTKWGKLVQVQVQVQVQENEKEEDQGRVEETKGWI